VDKKSDDFICGPYPEKPFLDFVEFLANWTGEGGFLRKKGPKK
jgi:hypothetical protein